MLQIRNARVSGYSSLIDIGIDEGRIVSLEPAGDDNETIRDESIDVNGKLVLPGFINAHAHIDKTLKSGPWVSAVDGVSVADHIAHERAERDRLDLPNKKYIAAMVEAMVAHGTTHIRTHTDVDPGVGIRGIRAVAEIAEQYADAVTIEQVAFPQGGLITNPGTLDLLHDAVAAGATTIGGLDPAGFDKAPNKNLEATFALAAETDTQIDIHLHDGGSLGAWEIDLIADMTRHYGREGRVAISHAFGIAHQPTQARLLKRLAECGIALVTAAVYDTPVPPIVAVHKAGVELAAGTDGTNDLWGPFGEGDMLRRAMLVAYRNGCRSDENLALAFRTISTGAAQVLGLVDYGLDVGKPADLVVVDARCVAEAVATVPVRELVIKYGRVVARHAECVREQIDNGY